MRPVAIALVTLILVPALAGIACAGDGSHRSHVFRKFEGVLGRHRARPRSTPSAEAEPPPPPADGQRRIAERAPGPRPDTFLAYQNALNAWHQRGAGLDDLWREYQAREAEYVADYTARFGREATAAASARAVAANPGHAAVIAPQAPATPRKSKSLGDRVLHALALKR